MYKLTLWSYVRKPNNISNTSAKKPNWVNHRALQIERETLPNPGGHLEMDCRHALGPRNHERWIGEITLNP